MTIQPTAVYPPGSETERYIPPPYRRGPYPYEGPDETYVNRGPGFFQKMLGAVPQTNMQVQVPRAVPNWMGNKKIIVAMWVIAIAFISYDEWHNFNILPRPQRLWDASLVYGLLAILSSVDPVAPIANMLAIGFTISLAYQYYDGSGKFGGSGKPGSTSGAGGGSAPRAA